MYLINHKDNNQKIIFVHVRKNAGTSIKSWFCHKIRPDQLTIIDYNRGSQGYLTAPIPELIDPNVISFAVVRNPYTRIISSWIYLNICNKTSIDLDTFLNNPLPKEMAVMSGHDWRHSFATQTEFLYNPVDGKLGVDYLLSFENLHQDWKTFKMKINLGKYHRQDNLPFENAQNYDIKLTQKQKNKIYNLFRADFENFGYERERIEI